MWVSRVPSILFWVVFISQKRQALQESEEVLQFVRNGREVLLFQASNVKEIGEARQRARDIVQNLPRIVQLRQRIEEENKLLRQMTGSASDSPTVIVDMRDIANEWDSFTTQIQQYGDTLEEQKERLQEQILKQV